MPPGYVRVEEVIHPDGTIRRIYHRSRSGSNRFAAPTVEDLTAENPLQQQNFEFLLQEIQQK